MTLATDKPGSTNAPSFTQAGHLPDPRSKAPQEKDRLMETNVLTDRPNR